MIKQLTKYLSLHALLRQHIQDKNREIFKFLNDKKLDATLDAIDAREGMVKACQRYPRPYRKNGEKQ